MKKIKLSNLVKPLLVIGTIIPIASLSSCNDDEQTISIQNKNVTGDIVTSPATFIFNVGNSVVKKDNEFKGLKFDISNIKIFDKYGNQSEITSQDYTFEVTQNDGSNEVLLKLIINENSKHVFSSNKLTMDINALWSEGKDEQSATATTSQMFSDCSVTYVSHVDAPNYYRSVTHQCGDTIHYEFNLSERIADAVKENIEIDINNVKGLPETHYYARAINKYYINNGWTLSFDIMLEKQSGEWQEGEEISFDMVLTYYVSDKKQKQWIETVPDCHFTYLSNKLNAENLTAEVTVFPGKEQLVWTDEISIPYVEGKQDPTNTSYGAIRVDDNIPYTPVPISVYKSGNHIVVTVPVRTTTLTKAGEYDVIIWIYSEMGWMQRVTLKLTIKDNQ